MAIAAVLLVFAGLLAWYSVCSYELAMHSPMGAFSARFFPGQLILEGNARYHALDMAGAEKYYTEAIVSGPIYIDAWIDLAAALTVSGNSDEARRILRIISPSLASISTWKMQELDLADVLGEKDYFERCYNYILAYLPNRVQEASLLGSQFWGGWAKVAPHVSPSNRSRLLSVLMDNRQPEAAVDLFRLIEASGPKLEGKDELRVCDFFLSNNRMKEAKAAWRLWRKKDASDASILYDGGFKEPPLNTAFGWRIPQNPDAAVARESGDACSGGSCSGGSCLHVHFKGSANLGCDFAAQIVPVEPGKTYRLEFWRKGEKLTTDQGVFVSVSGFQGPGPSVSGPSVAGDSPWKEETLQFVTPAGCEAVMVHVRRNESLMFDNKIEGDYWLKGANIKAKSLSVAGRNA